MNRAEREREEIKARAMAPDAAPGMTPEAFLEKFPETEERVDLLEDMACPKCGERDRLLPGRGSNAVPERKGLRWAVSRRDTRQ